MSHPALRTPPAAPPAPTPAPPPPSAPPSEPRAAAAPPAGTWRHDLGAGVVVALVALPLCLGIALASGAPLFAGIVTGVVGGLLVSRLSGSQLLVSGPAAGLTAIVVAAITELGSFPAFLAATVLAGALQLGLGALRAGIVAHFVPASVIRGMLAGIGALLIMKQLPHLVGLGGGGAGAASGLALGVATVGVLSLALLAAWGRFVPASVRRLVPGPLAVVLVGASSALALGALAPSLALPAWAYVSLPVPRSLGDVAALLARPDWSALTNPAVYTVAATIAIVASLETLLSLEATDKLDPERRTSPANRELLAQGAGNVVAGLLGGLPMTGVIVRSAANIDAGAKTWRSSCVHGALLAAAVLTIPALLNHIPLAALAAVLVATGFKLAHPKLLVDAWRRGPQYAVPFVVTVVAIVVEDLLLGIAVGLTAGVFFVLRDSYRNAYSYERRESADHHHVRLTLAEEVTFLNKPKLAAALSRVAAGSVVTVDASRTRHLDMDVAELLHDFQQTGPRKGITVLLRDVPAPIHAATAH